jgi:hypothetical protein
MHDLRLCCLLLRICSMLKHRPFSLSPVLPWVLLVSLFNPTTFGRPALFSRTGGPKETSREKCHEKNVTYCYTQNPKPLSVFILKFSDPLEANSVTVSEIHFFHFIITYGKEVSFINKTVNNIFIEVIVK